MPSFTAKIEFDGVQVIAETDKAILIRGIEPEPVWIPQSQIDDDSEVWKVGDTGRIIVSEWIAKQKGFI